MHPQAPRALTAELPHGWIRLHDENGREYFCDENTQTTHWCEPMAGTASGSLYMNCDLLTPSPDTPAACLLQCMLLKLSPLASARRLSARIRFVPCAASDCVIAVGICCCDASNCCCAASDCVLASGRCQTLPRVATVLVPQHTYRDLALPLPVPNWQQLASCCS